MTPEYAGFTAFSERRYEMNIMSMPGFTSAAPQNR
jgi:hypothetical protein